jgi:hypothetical protein
LRWGYDFLIDSGPVRKKKSVVLFLHASTFPPPFASRSFFLASPRFLAFDRHKNAKMGTGKKEATRRTREGKTGDGMGNVKTKGENFYRYVPVQSSTVLFR